MLLAMRETKKGNLFKYASARLLHSLARHEGADVAEPHYEERGGLQEEVDVEVVVAEMEVVDGAKENVEPRQQLQYV